MWNLFINSPKDFNLTPSFKSIQEPQMATEEASNVDEFADNDLHMSIIMPPKKSLRHRA